MLPDFRTPMLWALCLGLAAALMTAGVERTRAAKARSDLAAEQRDRAKENTARALAALSDLQRTVMLVAAHAKNQQENVDVYEKKLAVLDGRRRAIAVDADRVRKQFAAYAARDREQAAIDPAACIRIADRSAVLAGVAARGRELLERGRIVVEQRDAEVGVLLGVVGNDRSLMNAAPPEASASASPKPPSPE